MVDSVKTTSGITTVMDFSAAAESQHLPKGNSYGLYADGPLLPFRDANGTPTFMSAHSESWRIQILGDWKNGGSWRRWTSEPQFKSPRDTAEGHFGNRIWPFTAFARGSKLDTSKNLAILGRM